jgi:hypothetical protein
MRRSSVNLWLGQAVNIALAGTIFWTVVKLLLPLIGTVQPPWSMPTAALLQLAGLLATVIILGDITIVHRQHRQSDNTD